MPQKKDSSWFTEEVATITAFDGIRLSGKWAIPKTEIKGVAVILQGSGNVGANGDVSSPFIGSGYRGAPTMPSEQIASQLSLGGFASLRYDKRGFEEASELPHQTMDYLVRDAKSALSCAQQKFPRAKAVLVGFSEGALIASMVAAECRVDALFLLALLTRPIDEVMAYQFFEWPVELIQNWAKLNHEAKQVLLPFLGEGFTGAPWADIIDIGQNKGVPLIHQLISPYQKLYGAVTEVLRQPPLEGWYSSLHKLPPFSEFAKKISVPVFLYHGQDDAQIRWSWVATDQRLFAGQAKFQLFPSLGHCFSPMDGAAGEIKTSGPFDDVVLEALLRDLRSL